MKKQTKKVKKNQNQQELKSKQGNTEFKMYNVFSQHYLNKALSVRNIIYVP